MFSQEEGKAVEDAVDKMLQKIGFEKDSSEYQHFSRNGGLNACFVDKAELYNTLKKTKKVTNEKLLAPEAIRLVIEQHRLAYAGKDTSHLTGLAITEANGVERTVSIEELNNNLLNAIMVTGLEARMHHFGMDPDKESHIQI